MHVLRTQSTENKMNAKIPPFESQPECSRAYLGLPVIYPYNVESQHVKASYQTEPWIL